MKTFLLVISIWGFTAEEEWVYVGNNVVLDVLMPMEECDAMARNWVWRESNEYYKLIVHCEEAILPAEPEEKKETSL
tara:strand:+ start:566 stop:796 length:231 start_codon:yes stop_codon:yes gene_type:complete